MSDASNDNDTIISEQSSTSDSLITSTHTITNDKGQIQFTLFEKDGNKLVRIETEQPIIFPVEILQKYVLTTYDIDNSCFVKKEDVRIITMILMIVYILTILGVCSWCNAISNGIRKIEL